MGQLEGRGYEVRKGIFSAVEVGSPHSRKRLFILGRLAHAKLPRLQAPSWDSEYRKGQKHLAEGVKQCSSIPSDIYGDGKPRLQDAFPAWPVYGQYDWEAPRTFESSVGRTDDGISNRLVRPDTSLRNFRLECLGDEVVPQQVTLAFISAVG